MDSGDRMRIPSYAPMPFFSYTTWYGTIYSVEINELAKKVNISSQNAFYRIISFVLKKFDKQAIYSIRINYDLKAENKDVIRKYIAVKDQKDFNKKFDNLIGKTHNTAIETLNLSKPLLISPEMESIEVKFEFFRQLAIDLKGREEKELDPLKALLTEDKYPTIDLKDFVKSMVEFVNNDKLELKTRKIIKSYLDFILDENSRVKSSIVADETTSRILNDSITNIRLLKSRDIRPQLETKEIKNDLLASLKRDLIELALKNKESTTTKEKIEEILSLLNDNSTMDFSKIDLKQLVNKMVDVYQNNSVEENVRAVIKAHLDIYLKNSILLRGVQADKAKSQILVNGVELTGIYFPNIKEDTDGILNALPSGPVKDNYKLLHPKRS